MAIEFKLPELGENIETGVVISVLAVEGSSVSEGQPVLEIEAGKASMEIPSPVGGTVAKLLVAQGDTVAIGQHVLTIKEAAAEIPARAAEPEAQAEPDKKPASRPRPAPEPAPAVESTAARPPAKTVSAAPNVRRLARELGIDIQDVQASDESGRISLDNVKAFARKAIAEGAGAAPAHQAGRTRVEMMSAVRKATMRHMAHCWSTIPHVTQHDTVDITRLNELRQRFSARAEAAGTKLTVTAMLVKIVSAALKAFPKFNASIDPEKAEIHFKEPCNIGIAVDTDRGLVVPVIRGADHMSVIKLAVELQTISQKARSGRISPDELQGGTFSISNLGGIGGSFFTPIINSPEVAVLGVGRGTEDAANHMQMPLSLSYDHRLIDGADGARFLRWIVNAIKDPMMIYLEG